MGAPHAVLRLLVFLSLLCQQRFCPVRPLQPAPAPPAMGDGARRIHTTFRDRQGLRNAPAAFLLPSVPAAGVQPRGAGADCRAVCEARRAVHQRRGVRVAGVRREAAHPHRYGRDWGCSGQGMDISLPLNCQELPAVLGRNPPLEIFFLLHLNLSLQTKS